MHRRRHARVPARLLLLLPKDHSSFSRALVAGAAVVVIAACGSSSSKSTSTASSKTAASSAAPTSGGKLIGWASPVASNPETATVTIGLDKAAQQLGWQVKTLDANLSPTKQVSDVNTFTTLNAAGIVTWTLDPGAANGAYSQAVSKGAHLVGIAEPSSQFSTTIYPEIFAGCSIEQDAARYIASRIPNAQLLVIGGPPVPSLTQETNCFVKAAKSAGLKIAATEANTGDSASSAQPLVNTALTAHPGIQAIWAYNDPSAVGAGAVVVSHGKKVWSAAHHGVIVIGAGGEPEAISAIKSGEMTVTYDQNGPAIGTAAIEALAISLGVHHATLPKSILIPATRYDPSNVNSWVPDNARNVTLTYKFTALPSNA